MTLKTSAKTKYPTSPASPAAPAPPVSPTAMPIAKSTGRLSKMAAPAAAIHGNPSRSSCPSLSSSAAAGSTAIGSISERPTLCKAPRTLSPHLPDPPAAGVLVA
jgi:hypothetical protein